MTRFLSLFCGCAGIKSSFGNAFDDRSSISVVNESGDVTASKARLNKPTDHLQSLPTLTVPVFDGQGHAPVARRRSSSNFDSLAPLLEDVSLAHATAGEGNGPDSLWNTPESGRSSCPIVATMGGPLGKGSNQCGASLHSSHRSSRNSTTASPVSAAATRSPVSPMRHDFMTLIQQASNRATSNGAVLDHPPTQPHAVWSLSVAPDGCRTSCGSVASHVHRQAGRKFHKGADGGGNGRNAPGVLIDHGAHHRRQRRASALAAAAAPTCLETPTTCAGCILGDCCYSATPFPTCPSAPFARCSSSPDMRCGDKPLLVQVNNDDKPDVHDGSGGSRTCSRLLPTTSNLVAGSGNRGVEHQHGSSQLSNRGGYKAKFRSCDPLVQLPLSPLRPRDQQHTPITTSPFCTTVAAMQLSLRCTAPVSGGSGGGAPAATGSGDVSQLSPSAPASITASSGGGSYQHKRLLIQLREHHEAQLLCRQQVLAGAETDAGQQGHILFAAVTAPSKDPSVSSALLPATSLQRPPVLEDVAATPTGTASGAAAHIEPCGGSWGPHASMVESAEDSLSFTGTPLQLETGEAVLVVTRLLEANTLPDSTPVDPMCAVKFPPATPGKQWAAGSSSAPGTALFSIMSLSEGGHASGKSVAACITVEVQSSMSPRAGTPPLPLPTLSSQPGLPVSSAFSTDSAAGRGDGGWPTTKGLRSRSLARPEPWDLLLTNTRLTSPTAAVDAAATTTDTYLSRPGTPQGSTPPFNTKVGSRSNRRNHHHLSGPLAVATTTTSVTAAASPINTHTVAGCLLDSSSHADAGSMAHEAMGWFETCTSSKSEKTAPVSASSRPQSGGAVTLTCCSSASAAVCRVSAVLSPPPLVSEPQTLLPSHHAVTVKFHASPVNGEVFRGHPSFPLLISPAPLLSTPDVVKADHGDGCSLMPAASIRSLSRQPACIPIMTAANAVTTAAIMEPPGAHVDLSAVLTPPCEEATGGVPYMQCAMGSFEVPYSPHSMEAYSGNAQDIIRSPSHARDVVISGCSGQVALSGRGSVSASRRGSYMIASETSLTALAFLRAASSAVTLPDHDTVQLCDASGSTTGVGTGAGGGNIPSCALTMSARPPPLLLSPLPPSLTASTSPCSLPPSPHQQHYHQHQEQGLTSTDMGVVTEGCAAAVLSPPADGSPSVSRATNLRLEDGLVPEPHMLVEGLGRLSYMTSGAYAAVYKGTWEGMPVGVKFLASTSLDPCAPAVKEAMLGPGLDHSNVIHTYTTRLARIDARALAALKATAAAQASQRRHCPAGSQRRRFCVVGNTVTETPESVVPSVHAPAACEECSVNSKNGAMLTSPKSVAQIVQASASVGGQPRCTAAPMELSLNAISSANSNSSGLSLARRSAAGGVPYPQVLPTSRTAVSPVVPAVVHVAEACPALEPTVPASPHAPASATGNKRSGQQCGSMQRTGGEGGGGTTSTAKALPAATGGAAARHIFLRRSISANARGPHGSSADSAAGMHHHHPPPTSPLRPSVVPPLSPHQRYSQVPRSPACRQGLQKENSGGGAAGTVPGRLGMTASQQPLSPRQLHCQPATPFLPATPRAGSGVISHVVMLDAGEGEPAGLAADRLLWVLRALGVLGPSGQLTAAAYYVTAVVMEFADVGNLDSFSRGPQPCEPLSAVELMRQVASGMLYLHAHGLVHGDLKPANVLLLHEPLSGHLVAKVADFGLSGLSGELGSDGGVQAVGTIAYSAPERLADGEEGVGAEQAADVYSFGICLRQLVSGERPFPDLTYGQIMFGVLCQGLRPVWPTGRPASDALQPLYDMCTVAEPRLRPTFEQVLAWLDKLSRSHLAASAEA